MSRNTKNLSVLIVEDYPESREFLKEALSEFFNFVYVAEDGCDGLEKLKEYCPDIVLSDINMPCADGYDFVKIAKEQHFSPIFIFISAHHDVDHMSNAIDIKIDAYLVKPVNINTLMEKIHSLLEQKEQRGQVNQTLHESLSEREYEVFLDIAKGIMPRVIASKYDLKPKTVSTYRQRIFDKMRMSNNSDIIRYALSNNLI